MNEDLPAPLVAPRPPVWRSLTLIGALAFALGLGAMALVLQYRAILLPGQTSPAAPAAAGNQLPVVVVPATGTAVPPVIDLNALSTREDALAAKLADLEARTAAISGDAQAAAGNATRAEGLLVAFAARRALDRGLSLGYIEEQLRDRFGAVQPRAVATIVQAAREPVTIEDLRGGLDGLAPELVTGATSAGWLASLRRELGNLVVLHKAGTPSPLPTDRIARARRMLDGGQVEAALAEVSRMPGAAGAGGWTSAARRYVGARHALDLIETMAIVGQPQLAVAAAPQGMPTTQP